MLGLRVLTAMLLGRSSWNHEPISKYNMLGILEFVVFGIMEREGLLLGEEEEE